ncbi:MAG: S-adenosylmethionine:tRNA ribosyltransferase-isomerase [Candidatus Cryptobacteroides sp.]
MIPSIHIEDYSYPLTDDRIAKYPLEERDASKLLIYREGKISEKHFKNLAEYIPEGSFMVFNDTKVVPARLHFRRDTGAHIEIFCLQPVEPADYAQAFASTASCRWQCVIGNAKRWKEDLLSYYIPESSEGEKMRELALKAKLISREAQTGVVEFSWKGGEVFSNVLDACGKVPIPPYLNRETEQIDTERYQTVYAHFRGSVAAPTAGLHFTDRVLESLKEKNVSLNTVCLHVGAGTFLPVKSSDVSEHTMHREPFVVKKDFLKALISKREILVAVGTTSVRTLESLYYIGVSLIEKGEPLDVSQWDPYVRTYEYSIEEALQAIVNYLDARGMEELKTGTRIIIVPGFKFRLVDMLVTNFHQSESTLILLVAAFVGEDWRKIYDYALTNDFRFLSYGDSSLLFRKEL